MQSIRRDSLRNEFEPDRAGCWALLDGGRLRLRLGFFLAYRGEKPCTATILNPKGANMYIAAVNVNGYSGKPWATYVQSVRMAPNSRRHRPGSWALAGRDSSIVAGWT
jgi:hypothetical protein